jgi:hypothetical protein
LAWDDKFNNWYNRIIPDSNTPLLSWQEPVVASRYRWKKDRFWAIGFAIFVVIIGGSIGVARANGSVSGLKLLMIFGGLVVYVITISYFGSFARRTDALCTTHLFLSGGRYGSRIKWDTIKSARLKEIVGFQVVEFARVGEDPLEIFLDPGKEDEIIKCLGTLNIRVTEQTGIAGIG